MTLKRRGHILVSSIIESLRRGTLHALQFRCPIGQHWVCNKSGPLTSSSPQGRDSFCKTAMSARGYCELRSRHDRGSLRTQGTSIDCRATRGFSRFFEITLQIFSRKVTRLLCAAGASLRLAFCPFFRRRWGGPVIGDIVARIVAAIFQSSKFCLGSSSPAPHSRLPCFM